MVVSRGVIRLSSICTTKHHTPHPHPTFDHTYLFPEDVERAGDYDHGSGKDLEEEWEADHGLLGLARGACHHIMIHWLHPQATQQSIQTSQ